MLEQNRAIKLNYVREHNVALITSVLYERPLSCLELSGRIGISDVGVRKIVKELEAQGMLEVAPEENAPRKKGNQHIRYRVNAQYGFFLIVDFTHLNELYAVFDYAGNRILEKRGFDLPFLDVTDEDLANLIAEIKAALRAAGIEESRLLNVQLSVPGQIDEKNRCFTISHRFKNYENDGEGRFFRMFEEAFGAPVSAKNNVAYMALGEAEKGFASEYGCAIYLFVGYGIAATVLYGGEVVQGWRGYAGEIGGSKFGYDSTLSLNCSVKRLEDKCAPYLETVNFEGLLKAYRAGGPVREIILNSADVLAMFISTFSNLIGADVVMIGGEGLEYGAEYLDRVKKYVLSHTIAKAKVVPSARKNAAVFGALAEAKKRVIEDYNEKRRACAQAE